MARNRRRRAETLASGARPCYIVGKARRRKTSPRSPGRVGAVVPTPGAAPPVDFDPILGLIAAARAVGSADGAPIELYRDIGQFIGRAGVTVEDLAAAIRRRFPASRGYSASNLRRIGRLYQAYRDHPELEMLSRGLPLGHNLAIVGGCRWVEGREFYLRLAAEERWSLRELRRHLAVALFERVLSRTVAAELKADKALRAYLRRLESSGVANDDDRGSRLPDRRLLQGKLREIYMQTRGHSGPEALEARGLARSGTTRGRRER